MNAALEKALYRSLATTAVRNQARKKQAAKKATCMLYEVRLRAFGQIYKALKGVRVLRGEVG